MDVKEPLAKFQGVEECAIAEIVRCGLDPDAPAVGAIAPSGGHCLENRRLQRGICIQKDQHVATCQGRAQIFRPRRPAIRFQSQAHRRHVHRRVRPVARQVLDQVCGGVARTVVYDYAFHAVKRILLFGYRLKRTGNVGLFVEGGHNYRNQRRSFFALGLAIAQREQLAGCYDVPQCRQRSKAIENARQRGAILEPLRVKKHLDHRAARQTSVAEPGESRDGIVAQLHQLLVESANSHKPLPRGRDRPPGPQVA